MRIVLAVDGSDQSYYAARALEHLKPADNVIVLHAVDVPYPAFPMVMPEVTGDLYSVTEKRLREEGERVLQFVRSILPPKTAAVSVRLEVGNPAEMILSVAEEAHPDVIVLGSRGLGPVTELLLGSVSHRILAHATCPTLIVNRALESLHHILLPIQGPEDAGAAIRFLAAKPFPNPGEITVLSTEPFAQSPWLIDVSVAESVTQQLRQSAQRFVEDTAARLTALGYRATSVVRTEAPGAAIFKQAEATRPDLILMGSRGLEGMSRFLLGSVSHAVLNRAPCPVLIFR